MRNIGKIPTVHTPSTLDGCSIMFEDSDGDHFVVQFFSHTVYIYAIYDENCVGESVEDLEIVFKENPERVGRVWLNLAELLRVLPLDAVLAMAGHDRIKESLHEQG